MKNLKNWTAFCMLLIGIGSAFMFSAFNKDIPKYQYMSNSKNEVDIKNINNWRLVTDVSPDCGVTGSLVCQYAFDGDLTDFENFLKLPSTTAARINSNAESTKK